MSVAAIWGSVALWLLVEGRYAAAIGLVAYGSAVISTSDNLVRAHVIGHQASLHPLVSLITVLGAVKLMGLWGVFVGPMVAAFFFALLTIVHERYIQQNDASVQRNGDPWCIETSQSAGREDSQHSTSASEHHA